MNWKCRLGFHDWDEDSSVEFTPINSYTFQIFKYPERTCRRCAKYEYKGVYVIPTDEGPQPLIEREWV